MRITLPANLTGKALYKYLVENKAELISKKKTLPIKSDAFTAPVHIIQPTKTATTKAAGDAPDTMPTGQREVKVSVVANTAWWCDSHMDVLTDTCYDKSIKERGILIPHINDHDWKSTAHVGDVQSVYTKLMKLSDLGLNQAGSTTSLMFDTLVKEEYNADVYKFYKNGKINQHSIGLMYLSIELAVNDPDYEKEIDFWNKYFPRIINKDIVEERGYFWIVTEIKVLENSCVLFGSNELTPTDYIEETKDVITAQEPVVTTPALPKKMFISFGLLN